MPNNYTDTNVSNMVFNVLDSDTYDSLSANNQLNNNELYLITDDDDRYKTRQSAVSSPNASGNATAFIDTISQNENGVITATKKNLDTSGTWTGTAAVANKLGTSNVGDFLNPIYLSSGAATASKGNTIPFIVGTGTTAGTWTGTLDGLTAYYDGLLILYKSPVAGASTTTLNLNSIGAKTVYVIGTSKLTTHYAANQPILLVYSASQNSGCWMVIDSYWSNSNTIPAAQCNTAADTAAKTASCDYWTATPNSYIHVNFRYANTAASPTLNINSTGAKPIYVNGEAATTSSLKAGSYIAYYDGTNFQLRTDGYLPGEGTIGSASSFTNAQSITLTGNVTGSASSTAGWSIATTIANGAVTNGMLAGSIANGKLANSSISIAGNSVSLGGSLTAATLRSSLGLSNAMHFIGKATVSITDGSATDPGIGNYSIANAQYGDVIIDQDDSREYVWSSTGGGSWELLGGDSSYKVLQDAISNNTGTADSGSSKSFVYSFSQDTNGVVSVKTRSIPVFTKSGSGASSGLVPAPSTTSGTTKFLREDGTWQVPAYTTNTDTKVNVIARGTNKAYLLATTTSPTATAQAVTSVAETGVYLDTTAGKLVATSFEGSGSGLTALNASNVSSGTLDAARLPSVTRTNNTSTASPSHSGTFTAIDSITTDTYGRVTAINTKTVTLPSDNNTDTKVKQTAKTDDVNYKILMTTSASPTSGNAAEAAYDTDITINPSTNTITATNFAGTATKATQDGSGNNIVNTYLTKAAGVTAIGWDTTNKTLTQTVNSSASNVLQFVAGSNVTLTAEAGKLTIASSYTNTNYYHTTGTWSGLTYTATANGGAGALAFTIPTGTTSTTVALGNHTHATTIATSTGTNQITLAHGGKYAITAGGTSYIFTMPSDNNTDTLVTQTATDSTNANYELLFSATADNTTRTETARKTSNLIFNPSTGLLTTKNISLTGDLTITGDAYLNNQTYAEDITAGTLLVNGNTNFVAIPTAPTAADGTNDTQLATTAFVYNAFKSNDAMVFKGVVNSNSDLPATHYQGWTYKIGTAGTYAGQTCEIGDTIYCITDGTAANNAHWVVVQNNLSISTTAPSSSSTDGTIPSSKAVWTAISTASGYGKTGTVTSVAASGSGGISISGSPITTSGTIAIGLNLSTAINGLGEGASAAQRDDYIVAQYAGGGTTTTTYHRRKLSNIFKALNSGDITTALGYTPYNSTNPNGYTSNTGTVTSVATGAGLTGGTITTSGTIKANLNSETSLGTIGTTSKLYAVGVDANGKLCVNVPWTEGALYSAGTGLSLSGTTFSVKLGYTTSGNNRAVQSDSNGNLYVVQTDNNTTYSAGTGLSLSSTTFSVKLGYTTSGNNRAVQADSNGNLYVTQKDDNTTYSAGTGLSLSSNSFSVKLGYTTSGNNRAVQADTNGNLYVTQKDDNTTYSAGTGLSLSGTTFNHSNSVTAKISYGSTATTASANGGTIKVTDVQYDAQGHITASTDRTITLSQTTYTLSGLGGVGTVSASGTAPLTLSASKSGTTVTLTGSVSAATTAATGIVQLNSAVNSSVENQAATPKAVKTAYDLANNHQYWANIEATSSATYGKAPEMATIKLNGNTSASTASTKNVTLTYDSTLETLNFVFA